MRRGNAWKRSWRCGNTWRSCLKMWECSSLAFFLLESLDRSGYPRVEDNPIMGHSTKRGSGERLEHFGKFSACKIRHPDPTSPITLFHRVSTIHMITPGGVVRGKQPPLNICPLATPLGLAQLIHCILFYKKRPAHQVHFFFNKLRIRVFD